MALRVDEFSQTKDKPREVLIYSDLDRTSDGPASKSYVDAHSGSPTITTIEQDLGSLLSHGSFTVTDASCTTSSEVNIWQAFVPLRNKGTLPDENMMDRLRLYATPLTGEFLVYWEVEPTTVTVRELYKGSARNTGAIPQQDVAGLFKTIRLGIVSGYFKFKYTIQN